MAEYIERERLLSRFNIDDMMNVNGTLISLRDAREKISNFPAADVAPVRHGHWIEEDGCQICSECGEEHEWDEYRAAYCDVCGARMDGAEWQG